MLLPASARSCHAVCRVVPAALGLALLAAVPAFAQNDAPARPAHIHAGTCAELGDVVFPLADVAAPDSDGTPQSGTTPASTPLAGSTASPAAGGQAAAASVTTVEVPLADLLAADHAINLHESAERIGTYIACGDIVGGSDRGPIEIELNELNDSGASGTATLTERDGATEVRVELLDAGSAGGNADATPTASAEQAALTIDIKDFAYDPDPVAVAVGGSITWTNLDAVPHTATARDREVLQTGRLAKGETFTQTFEVAGSYDYFCEYHSGMKGTVVVE